MYLNNRTRKATKCQKAFSAFMAAFLLASPSGLLAGNLPSGASVVKGKVNIRTNGNVMDIDQMTSKAIVNWRSFDIGAANAVNIHQAASLGKAAMLARVTGNDPSSILGSLKADQSFYLVNPNGVYFGKNARVDVGAAFAASTLDITDADFMNGRMVFAGESKAGVVNEGVINAASAALIGNYTVNTGKVNADQIVMAGTNEVELFNFGEDAKLTLKFSEATDKPFTVVSNQGELNGESEVVLFADGGLADNSNGAITANKAEISGAAVDILNLGSVSVNALVIDPEGNLVIGNNVEDKSPTWTPDDPMRLIGSGEKWTGADDLNQVSGSETYYLSTKTLNELLEQYAIKKLEYDTITVQDNVLITSNNDLELAAKGGYLTVGDGLSYEGTGILNLNSDYQLSIGSVSADNGTLSLKATHLLANGRNLTLSAKNLAIADDMDIKADGSIALTFGEGDVVFKNKIKADTIDINAIHGDLTVDSNLTANTLNLSAPGELTVSESLAVKEALNLNSNNVKGTASVDGDITVAFIDAESDLLLDADLESQLGSITVTSNRGIDMYGSLNTIQGDVSISGKTGHLEPTFPGAPDEAPEDINLYGDIIVSVGGSVTITGYNMDKVLVAGNIVSEGDVNITAGNNIRMVDGGYIATPGAINLKAYNVYLKYEKAVDAPVMEADVINIDAYQFSNATYNVGTFDGSVTSTDPVPIEAYKALNLKTAIVGTLNEDGDAKADISVLGDINVESWDGMSNVILNSNLYSRTGNIDINSYRSLLVRGNLSTDQGDITLSGRSGGYSEPLYPWEPADWAPEDIIVKGSIVSNHDVVINGVNLDKVQIGNDVIANNNVTINANAIRIVEDEETETAGTITANKAINLTAYDVYIKYDEVPDTPVMVADVINVDAYSFSNSTYQFDDFTQTVTADTPAIPIEAYSALNIKAAVIGTLDADGNVKDNGISVTGDITVTPYDGLSDLVINSHLESRNGNLVIQNDNGILAQGMLKAGTGDDAVAGNVIISTKSTAEADEDAGTLAALTLKDDVEAKDNVIIDASYGELTLEGDVTAEKGDAVIRAAKNLEVTTTVEAGSKADIAVLDDDATLTIAAGGNVVADELASLQADGDVTVNGEVSGAGEAVLTSGANVVVGTEGRIAMNNDVTLNSSNDVIIDGTVTSQEIGTVTIDAIGNATITGAIDAGFEVVVDAEDVTIDANATVAADENITITGDSVTIDATAEDAVQARNGDVIVTALEDALTVNGNVTADNGNVTFVAANEENGNVVVEGTVQAGDTATVSAAKNAEINGTLNAVDATISAGADATVADTASLNVTGDLDVVAVNNATIAAVVQAGSIAVTAGKDVTTDALTANFGDISLHALSGNVTTNGGIQAFWDNVDMDADAGDILTNGTVGTGIGDITMNAAGTVTVNGIITAVQGNISLTADDTITLNEGVGTMVGDVNLNAVNGDVIAESIIMTTLGGDVTVTAGNNAELLSDVIGESITVIAGYDVMTDVLSASTGDVTVSAGNDVATNDAVLAYEGDAVITAGNSAELNGAVTADAITVEAGYDVTAVDTLTANDGDVTVAAGNTVTTNGEISAAEAAVITAGVDAALTAAVTANAITVEAGNNVTAEAALAANNGDTTVTAGNNAELKDTVTGNAVTVTAGNDVTAEAALTATDGDVTVTADNNVTANGEISATDAAIITAGVDATLTAAVTAEAITVEAGNDAAVDALTATDGDVTVTADDGNVTASGEISATEGDVILVAEDGSVTASAAITVNEGDAVITAGVDAALTAAVTADAITVDAGNDATVAALTANDGDVTVTADNTVTADGTISANAGDATITAGNNAELNGAVTADAITVDAGNDATIADALTAYDGDVTVTADNNVTANGAINTNNGDAVITAGTDAAINAAVFADAITVDAGNNASVDALTAYDGDVTVTAGTDAALNGAVTADAITVSAGNDATIADALTANDGDVTVTADNNVTANGAVNATNGDAVITAGSDAAINAAVTADAIAVDAGNDATIAEALTANDGDVTVTADNTVTANGVISANGDAVITAGTDAAINAAVTADAITVEAGNDATIADALTANDGDVTIAADNNVIANGEITAYDGDATITAGNDADINAEVFADGDVNIEAENNVTVDGDVTAFENAVITAGANATINETITASDVTITADENATVNAEITAEEGDVEIAAGEDIEVNATVEADDAVAMKAGNDINVEADVIAPESISMEAGNDVFADGEITTDGTVKVIAREGEINVNKLVGDVKNGLFNANGDITVEEKGTLTGAEVVSENGDIDFNVSGEILDSSFYANKGSVTMKARGGNIQGSNVQAADYVDIYAANEIDGTEVTAKGNTLIGSQKYGTAIKATAKWIMGGSLIAERGHIDLTGTQHALTTKWAKQYDGKSDIEILLDVYGGDRLVVKRRIDTAKGELLAQLRRPRFQYFPHVRMAFDAPANGDSIDYILVGNSAVEGLPEGFGPAQLIDFNAIDKDYDWNTSNDTVMK